MKEPKKQRRAPNPIRIVNTRTGRTITATNGRDAANIAKIELDRRSGIAATAEAAKA